MRKALIGLMLAGAAMVPAVANAQRGEAPDPGTPTHQREGGEFQRFRGGDDDNTRQRPQQSAPRAAPETVTVAQRGDGRRGGGEWRGRGDGNRSDGNRGSGEWRSRGDGNRGDANRTNGEWRSRGGNNAGTANPYVAEGAQFRDPRDQARYERRGRENAIRYGTQEQREAAIRDQRRDWRDDRRDDRRDWRNDRRDDRRDWRQDRRSDRRDWNRGWRNDNRYSWQDWRLRNRNLFRLPAYYSPYRNYGYQRFSIGLFLDRLFFDQRYWLTDPFYYRLPPAPYGTQWIRYYDDALLVDVYTGEVIDVVYDIFW